MSILGLPVTNFEDIDFSRKANRNQTVINCINAWTFYCYWHNPHYREALRESFNLTDGMSIVLGYKFLKSEKLKRFTGYDVLVHFLSQSKQYGIK